MTSDDILTVLKAIKRFDLVESHAGCECCGGWTEREYSASGDYVSSFDIDELIKQIEADDE